MAHDKVQMQSQGRSVNTVTGYGLGDRGSGIWFPVGARKLSFLHRGSEAHPTSYPMDKRGSFPGDKTAGAWSWSLTSIQCRG